MTTPNGHRDPDDDSAGRSAAAFLIHLHQTMDRIERQLTRVRHDLAEQDNMLADIIRLLGGKQSGS